MIDTKNPITIIMFCVFMVIYASMFYNIGVNSKARPINVKYEHVTRSLFLDMRNAGINASCDQLKTLGDFMEQHSTERGKR